MKGTWLLVRVTLGKELRLMRRYLINTVSEVLMLYVFFAAIFFGGRTVAPSVIDDSLSGITVGFFLLMMATVAYSGLSWGLIHEAQWGTLEQLYMSPYGFGRVVSAITGISLAVSFAYGGVLLALMTATTGRPLHVDPVTVLPVGVLALASAAGVGFVLGGLALLYKRIESLFGIIQFAFVGLVAAPADTVALKLLPLTLGSRLLRASMAGGARLWELPPGDLGLLAAKGIGYLLVGYLLFVGASRLARERGVLGHY